MKHDCRLADARSWEAECHFSGDLTGDGFVVPLKHSVRFGSKGCSLTLPTMRGPADIACHSKGQQFGSWIEVSELLGTQCRASGVVWSRVAGSSEGEYDPPVMLVVKAEIELVIAPGQIGCEAGTWNEARYYLVCAERPDPGLGWTPSNHRVCRTGVELVTFEAVHRKPDGTNEDDPWYRRMYAQVRGRPISK